MPQLAPMNWLILFIYFSILLVIVFIKLFFFFNSKVSLQKKNISYNVLVQKI